jgi:hypothetical protein
MGHPAGATQTGGQPPPKDRRRHTVNDDNDRVRTYDTGQGTYTTLEVPMGSLSIGDQFVGPDGHTLYEVTEDCASNQHGFLEVRTLNMTDEQAAALAATPGLVQPGCDPRDGLFAYPDTTAMHMVLSEADNSADTATDTATDTGHDMSADTNQDTATDIDTDTPADTTDDADDF